MAVVNVQKYNKAIEPELKQAEQVDDLGAGLLNSVAKGFEAGAKFAYLKRKEENEEQEQIQRQLAIAERKKLVKDNEAKTSALKDFTDFQYTLNDKFDELSSRQEGDLVPDFNTFYKQTLDKRVVGKSIAYREAFREQAQKYYNKIAPTIVEKDIENTKLRSADNLQTAIDNFVNSDEQDVGEIYAFADNATQYIQDMDIPNGLKNLLERQGRRSLLNKAVDVMTEQNPEYAYTFVENDETIANTFDEKQIQAFKKQANDTMFNQMAEANPVELFNLMQDKDTVKKTFKSFEDEDITKYREKAKKILNNYKFVQDQNYKQQKSNDFTSFAFNPSQKGFDELQMKYPHMTKSEREDLQASLDFVENKAATTRDSVILPYTTKLIEDLDSINLNSKDAMIDVSKTVLSYKKEIDRQNEKGFAGADKRAEINENLKLGINQAAIKYIKDTKGMWEPLIREGKKVRVRSAMLTKSEKEQISKIDFGMAASDEDIAEIVNNSISAYMFAVQRGDYQLAKNILDDGKKAAAEVKYPAIKGLKLGDLFSKNGVIYEYRGLDGTEPIINVK